MSEGVTAPPQWVLRDAAMLRLAGAEAYAPGDQAAATLLPAARLGGAKRVAENDAEGQRASRLARFAAPPPSSTMPDVVIIERAGAEVIVVD